MSATTQQFPSEIGTLAILVNSGLTVRRALLLNFFASTLTFVGFCLSILMDNILIDNIYESYIFGFSAGMYLYVVLSSLIPEIREQFSNLVCEASTYEIVFTTVLQALGVFSGLNLIFGMNK
ncbi:hypothetical protein M3Y94_01249300 [Aphelenchoides besseyi]|nr:hypothetical protein M3Y94_01249300 [Aphelenchoides besseyi]